MSAGRRIVAMPRYVEDSDCDLGWALAMANRGYDAAVRPVFQDFPRGARGYQLLHTVIHKKIRTQLGLAEYLGVDPTVMPYVIDDLVSADLVQRTDDPSDRRVRTIIPTDNGLQRYKDLSAAVAEAEEFLLSALDGTERQAFTHQLSAIARQARATT